MIFVSTTDCHSHCFATRCLSALVIDWVVNPDGFQCVSWGIAFVNRQAKILRKAIMSRSVKLACYVKDVVLRVAPVCVQNRFFFFHRCQCSVVPCSQIVICGSNGGREQKHYSTQYSHFKIPFLIIRQPNLRLEVSVNG